MTKDYSEINLKLISDYIRNGAKPASKHSLGLEIEHIIVHSESLKAVSYSGPGGIGWILDSLSAGFPRVISEDGSILGLECDDYNITLEPAGQLEISIAPRSSLSDITRIYESFLGLITPILTERKYRLLNIGYQPRSKARELPLIPKRRYRFMDEYFASSGTRGINMMRGSASTQISIDYTDEKDFINKYRAAYVISPAIKLLSDNSPVFEGELYDGALLRTHIWNDVDAKRCGVFPGLFDETFGYDSYARFIWELEPILIQSSEGAASTGNKRVSELWRERSLSEDDIQHLLSMSFLDARVKNYIEIRGADSMPFEYIQAYLALIKGLFFDSEAVDGILSAVTVSEADITSAETSLRQHGYAGEIYGRTAQEFICWLLELADKHLDAEERDFLLPFKALAEEGSTLAGKYNACCFK